MSQPKPNSKYSHFTFWGIILVIAILFFLANERKQEQAANTPSQHAIPPASKPDNSASSHTSVATRKISNSSEETDNLVIPFSQMISTPPVNDLIFDSRGGLWAATDKGVCSLISGNLKEYSSDYGTFPVPQAECLAFDGQKIWIGTMFGLYSMTRSGRTEKHEISSIPGTEMIWDILYDGVTIWVGTQSGAAFMDKDGKFITIDSQVSNGGLRDDWCQNILRFSSWFVAIHDKGISFWNTSFKASNPEFWKNIDNAKSGIIRPVSCAAFDGKSLWLGSSKGVLNLTTPIEKLFSESVSNFINYTTVHGLPSNRINAIIAHKGDIWVGTEAGLARISSDKIQTVAPADGSIVPPIRALAASGDILWLGTEKGIQFINTAMVN
ncbi:MAG: hypothetical protein Kow0029_26090 [Candidatus Rifleibacteriota bacterium]